MFRTLISIGRHPLNRSRPFAAIGRFVAWQIATRLVGAPIAVPFVGDTRLLVRRGMTGATGNVYCGLHEYEDMAFVLHVLRPGDLFVDVGANVGSYTILAAGVAGAHCIALEPIAATFTSLLDNVRLNDVASRVICRKAAAGAAEGTVEFTTDLDTGNHALAHGEAGRNVVNVPVVTLDGILQDAAPTLLKIDVEGFETRVIDGAEQALRSPSLLAVIMELNGSGRRHGFDDNALHERLISLGFTPARYDPKRRFLEKGPATWTQGWGNALYIRRWSEVQTRIAGGPHVQVKDVVL